MGKVSLGYAKLEGDARLALGKDGRKAARLCWRCAPFGYLETALTDLRFYSVPDFEIKKRTLANANRRFKSGERVILGLGLSRAFAPKGSNERFHWLQVNGIFFERDFVDKGNQTRLGSTAIARAVFHRS